MFWLILIGGCIVGLGLFYFIITKYSEKQLKRLKEDYNEDSNRSKQCGEEAPDRHGVIQPIIRGEQSVEGDDEFEARGSVQESGVSILSEYKQYSESDTNEGVKDEER